MIRKIFLVPLVFFVVLPGASAETLRLKSGKTVQGKIVERNEHSIQLDVGLGFPITYYTDEIKDISEDTPEAAVAAAPSQLPSSSRPTDNPKERKADELEQKGLTLMDQGQMDEGLELLRQAVVENPQASRHLNLGSMLLGNGVALQKQGKSDEALKLFQEAESHIQESIKGFDPNGETTFISDAYNLLGEMYADAFNDKAKAKIYFQKSLSFYENAAAKRGLAELQ